MPWSAADIAGDELTWYNEGKPFLLGHHLLRDANDESNLSTAGYFVGKDNTTSDQVDGDYPNRNAYDSFIHVDTRPSSGANEWYLGYTASGVFADFDTLIINHNNIITDNQFTRIRVHIADAADFTSSPDTIADTTALPASNPNRFVFTELDEALGGGMRRFSDVKAISIQISNSGIAFIPQVTEVWFGRRRQLGFFPNEPWDDKRTASRTAAHEAESGVETRYVRSRARAIRDVAVHVTDAGQIATLESWWSACREGTEPFYWIESPNNTPQAYCMRVPPSPEFNAPLQGGPTNRIWRAVLREQAPYVGRGF